jgi:hypothetical protein
MDRDGTLLWLYMLVASVRATTLSNKGRRDVMVSIVGSNYPHLIAKTILEA